MERIRRPATFQTLLPLLFLVATTSASAEVIESLAFQEYPVKMSHAGSLLVAINGASPVSRDGRIFHGETTWNVRWHFRWESGRAGRCRITESKVNVSGTILLPRLIGGGKSDRERFRRYEKSLRTHELGHYEIGKKAGTAIDRFLSTLPSERDCSVLETAANNGAYRVLEKHKKIERQYDSDTRHGMTQGAWLQD